MMEVLAITLVAVIVRKEKWIVHGLLVSEVGYGINIQVRKSKNLAIVKFTECDLNQLF